ncbi:integral membrane protein [Colletotrichum asianum]|uniref:Integral membrane protein n=1 Tax=Colletotrichum asianum TaxID=702518 RepID=A0A8H3WLA5_9PEZI|nr:integral membrane protein [Colletotrichum asianum]
MYEKAQGISDFLGPFPLFDTEAYRDRFPKEMKQKGGLFFPIFQREALAFSFENTSKGDRRAWEDEDDQHFAIKVYSGSINCVSGQQVTDSVPQEQNYIVCPRQRRLDGFKSADNETRQFVAMPLGWEYSAEHQPTDKEDVGGIQLQIAPRWAFRCSATASELGLTTDSVVAMSDFDPDIKLLNEFEYSFANRSRWQIHGRSKPLLYPMDETGQVIFSGAMESPFGKSAKIISSRALSTYQLLKQLQRVPGYNSPQTPSQESPQTVATKVARLSWGDQTPFWFNFIISTLNKADKQSRSSMTEILAIEKARSSNIHQLEALLPLLSKADFFNEKDFHQTQLLELISLSVNNVDSSRAQSHGCSPRVSTCLEALVDWMETESIGPDELLRCGVDLKLWHCPQKTPSLKCVARFLKQGGRSFLKDYGFNRGDLQMPVSRKVREMLLEDFISNGFHLNARDAHGRTILWTERQLTYMLLDNGARVDIPDNDGSTLLHALVAKQDPTSLQKNQGPLETLLNHQKGREAVNVRNRDGLTPYQLVLGIDAIHYWDIYTRLFDNAEADIGIVFPKGVYRDKLTYSLAKWQAEVGSVSAFRRPAAEERLLRARLAMSYS